MISGFDSPLLHRKNLRGLDLESSPTIAGTIRELLLLITVFPNIMIFESVAKAGLSVSVNKRLDFCVSHIKELQVTSCC